jgi:hypothetical protein
MARRRIFLATFVKHSTESFKFPFILGYFLLTAGQLVANRHRAGLASPTIWPAKGSGPNLGYWPLSIPLESQWSLLILAVVPFVM